MTVSTHLIIRFHVLVFFITTMAATGSAYAQKATERAQSGITKEIVSEQDYEKGKPTGKVKTQTENHYDAQGRLVTEIEYKDGKPDNSTNMEYDAEGKKTKEIVKNQAGKTTKTIEYKYANGLRTERITYDANGVIKTKKFYKYETSHK
jgi:YD repeat-containing protein